MEKNIFENAKFGDKFVTKNGLCALFLHNNNYVNVLILEHDLDTSTYESNGKIIDFNRDDNYNIISL